MPIAKFQVVQSRDTLLAADAVVNTVHLNHLGQDPDYDALCASVGGAFATWWGSRGGQLRVTAYGVEGPGPHDPLGTWMESSGSSPTSLSPREVALCLSYYAVMNKPRQRGRLFLPIGARDSSLGARPTDPQIAAAITLGQALSAVGGVNVDWVVWSPTDQEERKVTHIWCDDEWDTVRSRGRKSTKRTLAATSG